MKHSTKIFVLVAVFMLLANAHLSAQVTAPSPLLPSPDGAYSCSTTMQYSSGPLQVLLRNVKLSQFTQSLPPPPPGGSQIHSFSCVAEFEMSVDGGLSFSPQSGSATATMRVTSSSDDSVRHFDTEMLQLDLAGNGPFGPFMIRESPTLPSLGQTSIKSNPNATFTIDSFFDIFTELSIDGGSSWMPSNQSGHFVLVPLFTMPPELTFGNPNFPPKAHLLSKPNTPVSFSGTQIQLKEADFTRFTHREAPPSPGTSKTIDFNGAMNLMLSANNGSTFSPRTVTATASVNMTYKNSSGGADYFDTEMLSLNLSGGSLPPGVMIRESPTLASTGKTSVRAPGDGTYRISSFFDIFTEISLDGGGTWSPSASALITEVGIPAMTAPDITFAIDSLLPQGNYLQLQPLGGDVTFTNGASLRALSLWGLPPGVSPPVLDASRTSPVISSSGMIFVVGGADFVVRSVTVVASASTSHDCDDADGRKIFETEMLSMSLTATTGTATFMLRESPSKASLGRTTIRSNSSGAGGYNIPSFFDVFTELSLDGGATWSAATSPLHLQLDVPPSVSPEITFATDMLPARGNLSSSPGVVTSFQPPSYEVEDISIGRISSQTSPPNLGDNKNWDFGGQGSLRVNNGSGDFTLTAVTFVAQMWIKDSFDKGDIRFFDTEMLSMSISTITVTSGILIRESPTLSSRGKIVVIKNDTGNGGGFRVSSFFDVFLELSIDGGSTWSASPEPIRIQLDAPTLESSELTVVNDQYPPPADLVIVQSSPFLVRGKLEVVSMSVRTPPPPLGQTVLAPMNGDGILDFVVGAGTEATSVTMTASVELRHAFDNQGTSFFDTEMLSLDIRPTSSTVTADFRLRESPTKQSLGRATSRLSSGGGGAGGFGVSSFFDVFLELSTNGGSTWTPDAKSTRLEFGVPTATTQTAELIFASDLLPPRGGHQISRQGVVVQFSSGLPTTGIRNVDLRSFTVGNDPPALGSSVIVDVDLDGRMDLAIAGGDFGAVAVTVTSTVRLTHNVDLGDMQVYDTEMLQLNLRASTVTGEILIRESPTLASRGQVNRSKSNVTNNRISSFFDIFTELSVDGGATWTPASSPLHLQLDVPPPEPELTFGSGNLPPRGHLNAIEVRYTLSDNSSDPASIDVSFSTQQSPPALGETRDDDCDGIASFVWSYGVDLPTFVTTTATIRVTHSFDDAQGTQFFDTEMLSLSFHTATATADIRLRESPSKASLGRTSVRNIGSSGQDGVAISSFFDIFTEISFDGGTTWSPQSNVARMQLGVPPPVSPELTFATNNLPSPGHLTSARNLLITYANGAKISDFGMSRLTPAQSPPDLGDPKDYNCDGFVRMQFTGLDGPSISSSTAAIRMTHDYDKDGTQYFETEMLSMSLAVATPTSTIMLRESPTKQSLGRTTLRNIGSSGQDGVAISSFFDIFTEISFDGGATWSPQSNVMRIQMDDAPLPGTAVVTATDSLPPEGTFLSPPSDTVRFPSGVAVQGFVVNSHTGAFDLVAYTFGDGSVGMQVGTGEFNVSTVTYAATIQTAHSYDAGTTRFFDTEMLSMSLETATLTSTIMLRESPTKQSLGRTSITTNPGGGFFVNSFFDIFTELSVDGGSTWEPADKPLRLRYDVLQAGSVCISKYFDLNHNRVYDVGETPMANVVFHLDGTNGSYTGATNVSGQLYIDNITPGDYTLTEVLPAGYTYSSPSSGELNLTIGAGVNTPVVWLNSAASSDDEFRTATYMEWATAADEKGALKSIKCKPYLVDFSFSFTAPRHATQATVKFDMFTRGKLFSITGSPSPVESAQWDSTKAVVYAPPTGIDSLFQFRIDGRGFKGKKVTVKVDWITPPKGKKVTTKIEASAYAYNQPGLPMPNLHNVGEAIYKGGSLPNGGIVLGEVSSVSRGGTKDTFKYVYHPKYSDVLKSLVKVSRGGSNLFHAGQARCLDFLDATPTKPIIKGQKGLPPDKHNNSLLAELLTLKLNIAASDSGLFPDGFGELIYSDDDDSLELDGMTVREIADAADSVLSCYDLSAKKWLPANFKLTLERLNGAFTGPIDTASWNCIKPVLTGVKPLSDVAFLIANPGVVPSVARHKQNILIAQPTAYALRQNYPNPFNPTTTIQFDLPEYAFVTMKIYNMLGQEVATLVNHEQMEDGIQEVNFNASSLASGVYFYRIVAEGLSETEDGSSQLTGKTFVSVKKMVLMK